MNIIVCVKQVPDTTEVRFDKETGTLIRKGIPTIINPDDRAAIELALRLKDIHGGEVTVLSMGPPQARDSLLEAIGMGVDKGVLLTDRKFAGSDTWATSISLAGALKKMPHDLIICGRQAIDGDTAQVGPQIAEHLDIPQITYCEDIVYEKDRFVVKRQYEEGHFIMAVQSPCLVTALSEAVTPRFMTVQNIVRAFEGDRIQVWNVEDIEVDVKEIGLKGSPTRVKKSMNKQAKGQGEIFEVTPDESASIIISQLREQRLV